ncbi:MAG: hypothetical protein QOF28_2643 [Actinomycetota bacterium]|nr:hypothetical protein [Actinomycetota bacterium]
MRFTLHRSAGTQPSAPADGTPALDDALWPAQARGRRVSLAPLTTLLSVALIALLGLWGGAELQKRHGAGSAAAAAGPAGGFAGRFGGGARPGGATGTGSATGGATVGTVTVLSGKTLYLTSSTGAIVKATLTGSTTYTRNAKATKASLKPGDTAIVEGTKNSAGVVVATSVAATAKGVTSTAGGFPGGFGAAGTGGAAPGAAGGQGG